MDILALQDELRTIAHNGLLFATDPYDRERYERLAALASSAYGQAFDLPPAEVRRLPAAELGYSTPKVGADAAIFDDEGRILLVQRADDRRWCLPCGFVNPNESPAEAAVRETREETGLVVRPVQLVDVRTRLPGANGGAQTLVAVIYLCEVIGGQLRIDHESLAARYWPIDAVTDWRRTHRDYAPAAAPIWRAWRSAATAAVGPRVSGAPAGHTSEAPIWGAEESASGTPVGHTIEEKA